MSGTADDDGMNQLAGSNRAPSIAVPVTGEGQQFQPLPPLNVAAMRAHVMQHMTGMSPADVMRHRDVAGREMETLAAVASGSRNMSRSDVAAYLGSLTAKGDINPAEMQEMLASLPSDQRGIRQWARAMFAVAMLRGIQGHAAYPLSLYPSALPGDVAAQEGNGGEDAESDADEEGEEAASG